MAHENLIRLARSFPNLEDADGLSPFDAEALDRWATGPSPGHGALYAAQFVLSVYNLSAPWQCGTFNVVRAMATWDRSHREAFLAWARDPWCA